ncbi:hypothetical protein [Legionella septentrionalis]|uniref:hypothetical protein n=1 Tax=Legionella septentrionalis TaxID=2498109 RepID=UPI000F8F2E19|nr:hypothetical protein [Legionella septentrionalis]RUR14875.1 hypothetical protein ELY10_07345 [Legionella septentrionalis]
MLSHFFQTPAVTAPRVELPTTIFDYQCHTHLKVLQDRMLRFNQALSALKQLDQKIVASLTLGTACWLFPNITFSVIGFCLATHWLGKREAFYSEYMKALADLKDAYAWAMGESKKDMWYKMGSTVIQELILTLGPVLSKDNILKWEKADLQPAIISGQRAKEPSENFKKRLESFAKGKQERSWEFQLYGEQGSPGLLTMFKATVKESVLLAINAVVQNRELKNK